jgi:hypothetical protein
MLGPFLFQLLHGKALNESLSPFKICLQSAYHQGFTESPGTTQKYIFEAMREFVHKGGLVYIQVISFPYFRETGNSHRIFWTTFHTFADFWVAHAFAKL